MKQATALWLLLLALTALTTQASTLAAGMIVPLALAATFIKGQVVIDHFMALRHVAGILRWLVPAWLMLLLGLIAYAFTLNPN